MQALIQRHANSIQAALLDAHADLSQIGDPALLLQCTAALDFAHDAAALAFRRLLKRCPDETQGVQLLSGPVEK